jgi:hypothetical protein
MVGDDLVNQSSYGGWLIDRVDAATAHEFADLVLHHRDRSQDRPAWCPERRS